MYFYFPAMSQGFTATGTVSLTYASLPTGSRVDFNLRAGNVPCNNAAPTASVTAPAAGTLLQAGSAVTLTANAADPDGTIQSVQFLANGTPIGTATASPYSILWTPSTGGAVNLTARATDNAGDQTLSAAVAVTVNAQPTATIMSPTSGIVVQAPGSVILTATAADSDGTITKVDFHRDGVLVSTDIEAPYEAVVTGLAAGTYSFTAVATDNQNGTGSSAAVNVVVNAIPNVSITSPAGGATFTAGSVVPISTNAADSDGTISRVELYANGTLIATLTSAPYNFNWVGVAVGTYALTAKAVDNDNGETTSAGVSITVQVSFTNTLFFIHTDHLNTPRAVYDANQQLRWQWDQIEPFGLNLPHENPLSHGAFDFPLRFPGQYADEETNLFYNYFRDYDSSAGRYTRSDPLGLVGGLNTFAYVGSNSLSYVDPWGLAKVCQGIAAAAFNPAAFPECKATLAGAGAESDTSITSKELDSKFSHYTYRDPRPGVGPNLSGLHPRRFGSAPPVKPEVTVAWYAVYLKLLEHTSTTTTRSWVKYHLDCERKQKCGQPPLTWSLDLLYCSPGLTTTSTSRNWEPQEKFLGRYAIDWYLPN
jgi:RHS repeat-associated protein